MAYGLLRKEVIATVSENDNEYPQVAENLLIYTFQTFFFFYTLTLIVIPEYCLIMQIKFSRLLSSSHNPLLLITQTFFIQTRTGMVITKFITLFISTHFSIFLRFLIETN